MCKGFDGMLNQKLKEGVEKERARQEIEKEKDNLNILHNIIAECNVSLDKAMEILLIPEEEKEKYRNKFIN